MIGTEMVFLALWTALAFGLGLICGRHVRSPIRALPLALHGRVFYDRVVSLKDIAAMTPEEYAEWERTEVPR